MAVNYRLVQNNRKNSTTRGMWYGRAVTSSESHTSDLAKDIEEKCTLTESDVIGVINELGKQIGKRLRNGERVILDKFGAFKVGISTTGAETAKAFNAAKNVKSAHIIFQPYTEKDDRNKRIKTMLTGLEVKEQTSYYVEKEEEEQEP